MRVAATIAFLVLAPAVAAADADPQWAARGRTVEETHSQELFEATSTARSPYSDAFTVRFSPADANLQYAFTDAEESASLAVHTRVVAVTEWRDDGDGQYGPQDQVVRRITVDSLEPTLSVRPQGDGYRVEALYLIPPPPGEDDPLAGSEVAPGRLTVAFHILASQQQIAGRTVDPVEVPARMEIEDFPYAAQDTRLALEAAVGTDGPLAAGGSKPVHAEAGPYQVHYDWAPQAYADGAPIDARATQILRSPQTDGGLATVLFAFPRAQDAAQDITLGTTRFAPEGAIALPDLPIVGDAFVYSLAAAGAVAAVSVPAWVRLRGRR